jgi:hypothetical protein
MKKKKGIVGEIKKGSILVCIETQSTSCGIKYVKMGSIIKCALDAEEYYDTVRIFRNEREMSLDNWKPIDREKLRFANPEEEELYYKGVYHLEPATEATESE